MGKSSKKSSESGNDSISENISESSGGSSIASIFGSATGNQIDSSINNLFKNSTGAVDRKKVVSKQEPVLETGLESGKEDGKANGKRVLQEKNIEEEVLKHKKVKKSKNDDVDENFDLESNYLNKLLQKEQKEEQEQEEEKVEEESSDEEEEIGKESVQPVSTGAKTIDLKKDDFEKAERTIFIGNLSSQVITDKKIYKQFKRKFQEFGNIESTRFRSISFNDNLPRKVAYIHKNLLETKDNVNAYIVFENKQDSLKATNLNGTIFLNHHLRVDHLTHPLKQDNKKSIFIGNLDFEEKEETLWKFFSNSIGEGEIDNVRIIRDSKTNFGKGFAIVQFKDTINVDKALLLNNTPLSNSKNKQRNLRITRCKNMSHLKKNQQINNTSNKFKNLSEKEKTVIGRAKKVLNKNSRSSIGKTLIEGQRSHKGDRVRGIKNGIGKTTGKVKKPRIRERSSKFKKERAEMNNT
ncbi:hypothetical protein PACTADRAFT_43452 [Pachysolen tannophilus NRRL Y-2460]|uniref:Nucleolar protein 12 n=1 Tax=Pachysolen tannophilus NRRL Y-2460 TaxID=669874 RepID=A0A1E4TT37_PACTA|nr:hypothetical protein PACTADRAFT_43452 [Pachysolen tannophilus NRRL Y-2460]